MEDSKAKNPLSGHNANFVDVLVFHGDFPVSVLMSRDEKKVFPPRESWHASM